MKDLKDLLLESLNESSPKYSREIVDKRIREIDKRISKLKKEPSSDEMSDLCEWIASLNDEESAGYFLRTIIKKFPRIREEWGEVEGQDKYKEGAEILAAVYGWD